MESRRRERIRWFKRISLTLLNSVKKQYQELSKAVSNYAQHETPENEKRIESIANASLQVTVHNTYDIIVNREIPNAAEYIENPWIIAKLADSLSLMGGGFMAAKRLPSDISHIQESIKLSLNGLDFAIEQIENERD